MVNMEQHVKRIEALLAKLEEIDSYAPETVRKERKVAHVRKFAFDIANETERYIAGHDGDLSEQIAAAIMDHPPQLAEGDAHIPWGDEMSEVYVDVARMARDAARYWVANNVGGVIYEFSDDVFNACMKANGPINTAAIEAICVKWKDSKNNV